MEVVVTTGAIRRPKLQSSRHHRQTNTQLSRAIKSLSQTKLELSNQGTLSLSLSLSILTVILQVNVG